VTPYVKYRDTKTGDCRLRIGRVGGRVVFIVNADPNWLSIELRLGRVLLAWSVGL
jgi:hypothetical protein